MRIWWKNFSFRFLLLVKNSFRILGPVGYPIVGYLPFLGPEAYADIGKIGKKYGDVFSIKMGSYWYVVLNDFNIIKNALKDEVTTGRPNYLLRMSFYKKGQ